MGKTGRQGEGVCIYMGGVCMGKRSGEEIEEVIKGAEGGVGSEWGVGRGGG